MQPSHVVVGFRQNAVRRQPRRLGIILRFTVGTDIGADSALVIGQL